MVAKSPNPNEVKFTKEELPLLYQQLLKQNPLLARTEGAAKVQQFTDLEIRTIQLLLACKSNASLTQALDDARKSIAVIHRK